MNFISFFHSFRFRLAMSFLLLTILPFVALGPVVTKIAADSIRSSSEDFMSDLLEQNAARFTEKIGEWTDLSEQIILSPELQRLFQLDGASDADAVGIFSSVYTYLNQMMNNSTISNVKLYPLALEHFPASLYQTSLFYSSMDGDANVQNILNQNDRPVWVGNKQLPGSLERYWVRYMAIKQLPEFQTKFVMGIYVSNKTIESSFLQPSRWKNLRTIIVNTNGEIMLDSKNRNALGTTLPADLLLNMKRNPSARLTTKLDQTDYALAYRSLSLPGWYMLTAIPRDDLLQRVDRIRELVYTLSLVFVIIAALMSFYLGRKLSLPIGQLVKEIKQVERGEFQLPIAQGQNPDELGYLQLRFRNMLEQIRLLMENNRRAEERKKELQFQVLSNQINPHLVYNTLDAIKWKAARLPGPESVEIGDIITKLAQFMRLTLNRAEETTTVARELDHIRAYASLEQLRQPGVFDILFDVSDEALGIAMPKLLLQPIIENAMIHGCNPGGKTRIILSARIQGQDLVFQITDNGPGLPESLQEKPIDQLIQDRKVGIGLSNVHERVVLRYGRPYGLSLHRLDRGGTKVELRLPISDSPDKPH